MLKTLIRVLLVPSSDYLGHPFPQRHNQIFERLHDGKHFEVHVVRFKLFDQPRLKTKLIMHEIGEVKSSSVGAYYLRNMISHAAEIRKIVRQENIDVVVLSNLSSPFAYTLIDELSSIHVPVIFDLPDYYPTSAAGYLFDVKSVRGQLLTKVFDCMLRYLLKRSTVVTAASHALVKYSKSVGAQATLRVPNGISDCFLQLHNGQELRQKLGFNQEDIVVGYIGSVEFWLKMECLIQGLFLARERNLPVKLLIVGKGLHTGYSKKIIGCLSKYDFERDTKWLDFIPHELVPEYISALDVGTIPFDATNPTAFYSAPNKMWEYLSQKISLISTPIPEVMTESECLWIASTPNDYAHNISLIAKKDFKILQKVEQGYSKAKINTWDESAKCFVLAIYMTLNMQQNKALSRN